MKAIMYKPNGLRIEFDAINRNNALELGQQKYTRMGLIGRYYIQYNGVEIGCIYND
jgi:hypothetical protein